MSEIEKLQAKLASVQLRNQTLQNQVKVIREKERQLVHMLDVLYDSIPDTTYYQPSVNNRRFDGITFIVVAYEIPKQLRRTLISCSCEYFKAPAEELEIIIVDNGSKDPLHISQFTEFPEVSKVLRVDGKPSPVFGLNMGIEEAKFSNVALMIDGAHMLSPGVYRHAKSVLQLMPRPVINVPQYMFGDVSQNYISSEHAFDEEAKILEVLDWPKNGYRLFDHALFPGEGVNRSFLAAIESNCIITTKDVLKSSGGFDERFDEPGAGLANIEIFKRLTHDPKNEYVTLPGEGSFHQHHGGTTTSVTIEERQQLVAQYYEKYKAVTGDEKNFQFRAPFLYGPVSTNYQRVPSISHEYGKARKMILNELAEIYTYRAINNQVGKVPKLTFARSVSREHEIRPTLNPSNTLESECENSGLEKQAYSYINILKVLHACVKPKLYFEIGVDNGDSITLANCQSVGVDPSCEIVRPLRAPTRIFRLQSDKFFENRKRCNRILSQGIDLAYIDGMHLAEYVIRDFINVEKWSNKNGVIVLDDVLPDQVEMAERERRFNAWCGDVYKAIPILKKFRPDLQIEVYRAYAGQYRKGLAVISNLNPSSSVLEENYDQIMESILGEEYAVDTTQALEQLVPTTELNELEARLAKRQ